MEQSKTLPRRLLYLWVWSSLPLLCCKGSHGRTLGYNALRDTWAESTHIWFCDIEALCKGNQPWSWRHLCSTLLLFLQVITLFSLVFCPWNWSYGLSHARQAFYPLGHISGSRLIFHFETESPKLPRLVWPQFVAHTDFHLAILPQPPTTLPSLPVILNWVFQKRPFNWYH